MSIYILMAYVEEAGKDKATWEGLKQFEKEYEDVKIKHNLKSTDNKEGLR